MSGGSYDYLCFTKDLCALCQRMEDLEHMHERLAALPWARAAADETARLIAAIRVLESNYSARSALRDVWHAIEWWDSGDWAEDGAREALLEYERLTVASA